MIDIERKVLEIIALCAKVNYYADNDMEITIGGNGCNAYELRPMAIEIMRIFNVDCSDPKNVKVIDEGL